MWADSRVRRLLAGEVSGAPVGSHLVFPHTGPGGTVARLVVNESWTNWVTGPQPAAALAVPKACQ